MIKKIKYSIVPIIIFVLLFFSSKVLASYRIEESRLYYIEGNEKIQINFNPDSDILFKGNNNILDLTGWGIDKTKDKRKELINENVKNLLGARLAASQSNYLYYRRSLCLAHERSHFDLTGELVEEGTHLTYEGADSCYVINYILDLDFDDDGKMIYKYYFLDSTDNNKLKYQEISELATNLNAMIYTNGKYNIDNSDKHWYKIELDTIWQQFARRNKQNDNTDDTIVSPYFIRSGTPAEKVQYIKLKDGAKVEYESQVSKYNNFKKISKKDVKDKNNNVKDPKEIESININGKTYTVVGPFSMDFNDENRIKNELSINGNMVNDFYWIEENDYIAGENWKSDATKINPDDIFYLAINDDNLPDQEIDYKIIFYQNEMEYHKSRILLLNSSYDQQLGEFIEDDDISRIGGNVTYTIHHSNISKRTLKIIKYKSGTQQTIDGVKLKIYAKLDTGNKGWLISGDELTNNFNKGTEFETSNRRTSNNKGLRRRNLLYI